MENYPIDIVVTWVNGNDPEWLKEKNKYIENDGDKRNIRFRDWELMKYWFRGIEEFMPWIRYIFFVTWGHTPEWLNLENKKLKIVSHRDFIPLKYLPTFNSNAIEWNLHRINGLSDRFIYSNDDMYVIRPMKKEDFFRGGLPRHCSAQTLLQYKKNGIDHTLGTNLEILNDHFNKHKVIKEKISNWINLKYGKYNLYNLYLYPFDMFTGFRIIHTFNSFLKSTYEELWQKEYEILDETCNRHMRGKTDANIWLISYWQMALNYFVPKGYHDSCFLPIGENKKIFRAFSNPKCKMICLNDDIEFIDFEKEKQFLSECFENILPKKSSFEL